MRMARELMGILPIVATPFDEQGQIDEECLRRLVNYLIESGTHGLAPVGGSAECYDLSREERERLTDLVIEETGGRVPVLVGTSSEGTETSKALSVYAERAGADGVFVMPPTGVELDDEGIFAHYRTIAEAIGIPVMVHTPAGMSLDLIVRMIRDLSNVEYVKEETSPTGIKITQIIEATEGEAKVFSGCDQILIELARDAIGGIPGSIGVPSYARIFDLYRAGDRKAARAEYYRMLPLTHWRGLSPLEATKEFLCRKGIFRTTYVRRQGGQSVLDDVYREELTGILEHMGEPC